MAGYFPPCGTPSCTWDEFPFNPVYSPPTPAYYQTVRFRRDGFSPFGPFAYYKMWYDYSSSGGIAFATSPDGINWSFQADTTGLIATARHSRVLFDPAGFGIGAPYRIWYWDSVMLYVDDPVILRMLRTAVSVDGINWTHDETLAQNTAAPLLEPFPAYNRGSYGPVDVLYFSGNPPVLDLINPFNNRFVMYYNITDGSTEEIALAVSVDGITWSKVGPLAVLPTGGAGAWDSNYATEQGVVLQLAPNQFMMWYSGGVLSSHEGIGCASSTDGVNWTKFSGNPILSIFDGVAWHDARICDPWVLFDPLRFSGHGDPICFKFWLTGATVGGRPAIGYATNPLG